MSDEVVRRALIDVARNGLQFELLIDLLESLKLTPSEFQRARRALGVAGGKAYPSIVWACTPSAARGSTRRHAWQRVSGDPWLLETCCYLGMEHWPSDVATEAADPWDEDDRRCDQCKTSLRVERYEAITKEEFSALVAAEGS
ncbi:hypothetical protein LCGC14_0736280 [marine sediment metagenome]|uniref:Uncharacterized protein n=1 Tax=marine sediment metagenome TaxID=412755 RepID=A0A0F9Q804_9ZZZZ